MYSFRSDLKYARTFSNAVGALTILVAALVLAGWTLNIRSLKHIYPTLVAMNPVSAVWPPILPQVRRETGCSPFNGPIGRGCTKRHHRILMSFPSR